jgi:mannose-6-phosphate isomerase-like protein (cupin superfamily)
VERGRTNASLGSLQKIAAALGLTIGEFFDSGSSRRAQVLRKDDRPSLGDDERSRTFLLTPAPFENIEVFVGQFPQGGSTGDEQYVHGDSEELMVVISGRVLCQLENKEHVLSAGDSIHYRSSMPHRVVNVGDEPAEVLWVTSPPAY